MRRLAKSASTVALLAVSLALPTGAPAQQIGTVASQEPTLRGTPPGAATRQLNIGTGLLADETVQSSASGRGQLMFLDQTTLSLAPNTTIVLDRFVFDPAGGDGALGLRLTQGALRFIGGALSEGTEATITTPAATIGIRGSSALVLHQGGQTIAIFIAGDRLCAVFDGRRTCTSRQGGVLTSDGYIGRADPAYLAQVLALIDGAPVPGGTATGLGTGGRDARAGATGTRGQRFDDGLFVDDAAADDGLNGLPGRAAPIGHPGPEIEEREPDYGGLDPNEVIDTIGECIGVTRAGDRVPLCGLN